MPGNVAKWFCVTMVCVVPVLMVLLIIVGFGITGPRTNDTIWYVYIASRSEAVPEIMGRYFSIYAVMAMHEVFSYWPLASLAVSLSAYVANICFWSLLAYKYDNQPLAAIITCVLLMVNPVFTKWSIDSLSDQLGILFSGLAIASLSLNARPKLKHYLASGALLALCSRSRELIAVATLMPLLLLWFFSTISTRDRIRTASMALFGFVIAWLILMAIDGAVLGQPLFSVLPSTLDAMQRFNERAGPYEDYTFIEAFANRLTLPFALFLAAGAFTVPPFQRLPASLLAFSASLLILFSVSLASVQFGFADRFLFTVLIPLAPLTANIMSRCAGLVLTSVKQHPAPWILAFSLVCAVGLVGLSDPRRMFFHYSWIIFAACWAVLRLPKNAMGTALGLSSLLTIYVVQGVGTTLTLLSNHSSDNRFWQRVEHRLAQEPCLSAAAQRMPADKYEKAYPHLARLGQLYLRVNTSTSCEPSDTSKSDVAGVFPNEHLDLLAPEEHKIVIKGRRHSLAHFSNASLLPLGNVVATE